MNLEASMSRRRNYHVMSKQLQKTASLTLKPNELNEISTKTTTLTCAHNLFYYMVFFYNIERHYAHDNDQSPVKYENAVIPPFLTDVKSRGLSCIE